MINQRFDDEIIKGRTTFSTLPDCNVALSKGSTIISVTNLHLLVLKNTGAVTVTTLNGGTDGMTLKHSR
jgi:hypothetical protein